MDHPNGEFVGPLIAIIFMVVFYGGIILMSMGIMVLWIVALVDVVRREFKEPNDKLVWVLVVALTHWLGALIYLAIGRQKGWLPGQEPPPQAHHPPPPVPPS